MHRRISCAARASVLLLLAGTAAACRVSSAPPASSGPGTTSQAAPAAGASTAPAAASGSASAANTTAPAANAVVPLTPAELDRIRPYLPSQSHTMQDVSYHWENLWFAARYKNWPLAEFYFNETRQHILWTIRIRPVRKDADGKDVDIKAIFDAIDTSSFADVKAAIQKKDSAAFEQTYRTALDSCHSCHKSAGKPFLRPRVPTQATGSAEAILDFRPEAAAGTAGH
jgi:hypothetical protein